MSKSQTLSPVIQEMMGVKETFIGKGNLLRLVNVLSFSEFTGGMLVKDVFAPGKKIGDVTLADVDATFLSHFGDVVLQSLSAVEIPVWEVSSREARYWEMSDAVYDTWLAESINPGIVLARLYQTIEQAPQQSRELERNLLDGMANTFTAHSPAEQDVNENPYTVLWTFNSRYGHNASVRAQRRKYLAGCAPRSRIFGGKVPAPTPSAQETPPEPVRV
ncbi:hypothetical protein FJY93_01585 [Candidatus Kaiserbacteria bacterium]|nr:hypothetical protein [Candidatus Kaiserbacteria bacterium]